MIDSIGIDAVEIHRFAQWHTVPHQQLLRIFSRHEIEHCLAYRIKSAERFAVRFAAKEAFFKAWHSAFPTTYVPLLTMCRAVSITESNHTIPQLTIQWDLLPSITPLPIPLVSLTHTQTTAIACVFLKNIQSETKPIR